MTFGGSRATIYWTRADFPVPLAPTKNIGLPENNLMNGDAPIKGTSMLAKDISDNLQFPIYALLVKVSVSNTDFCLPQTRSINRSQTIPAAAPAEIGKPPHTSASPEFGPPAAPL